MVAGKLISHEQDRCPSGLRSRHGLSDQGYADGVSLTWGLLVPYWVKRPAMSKFWDYLRRVDWMVLACGAVIAVGAIAVYGRTYSVPLIYDDIGAVLNNQTIRHWDTVLQPPIDSTVSGRPVVNISLAINYAIDGISVVSYHVFNLGIHILAGLVLFGVLRRTLDARTDAAACGIAFCSALLWTVHPLQTESVTYIVQRCESLMGLFYLLTLYCFIRGARATGLPHYLWFAFCIGSCAIGMATKEVMASAPLIILFYDRTFIAASFREAFRRRWKIYGALAGTWLILAFLILSSNGRNGTVGFGAGVAWWRYALTQLPAIAHYIRLCFWPHPLIFDYGSAIVSPSARILPYALLVVALMAATLWALVKQPAAGFLGLWFFAILAPSSSIVPVATETIAEHRMYLALIPVVLFAVLGIYRWLGSMALPACLVLAASLGLASAKRNNDYSSADAIWSDTISKLPENYRAFNNLGYVRSSDPARQNDVIAEFEEALRLNPKYAEAHSNLGNALLKVPGRLNEATAEIGEALRLDPNDAEAHNNLGNAWSIVPGRSNDAIAQYQEAIRLGPYYAEAHYNLGNALASSGQMNEAIVHYQEAIRLRPDFVVAHFNLGQTLARMPGRSNEAIAEFEETLRLKPDYVEAHYNLGNLLYGIPGRLNEAIAQYEETLRLKPDAVAAHFNLAVALLRIPGGGEEARAHLREVLRLEPKNDRARNILAELPPLTP
jgi:protein O-mannosyl-transferase